MFELGRDWLYFDKAYINTENIYIYINPNMVTIRKLTSPIVSKEIVNNNNVIL
jgi:hypothetical protein